MILPGRAMLSVCDRPSFGTKTAEGFEVSTVASLSRLESSLGLRFCSGSLVPGSYNITLSLHVLTLLLCEDMSATCLSGVKCSLCKGYSDVQVQNVGGVVPLAHSTCLQSLHVHVPTGDSTTTTHTEDWNGRTRPVLKPAGRSTKVHSRTLLLV